MSLAPTGKESERTFSVRPGVLHQNDPSSGTFQPDTSGPATSARWRLDNQANRNVEAINSSDCRDEEETIPRKSVRQSQMLPRNRRIFNFQLVNPFAKVAINRERKKRVVIEAEEAELEKRNRDIARSIVGYGNYPKVD